MAGCEDAEIFEAAAPVDEDGTVRFDNEAIERREDAIAGAVSKGCPLAVVVLDGSHDFADSLRKRKADVVYVRVRTQTYPGADRLP